MKKFVECTTLEQVRIIACTRHAKRAKSAKKQGRDFPLFPYECSWAFEEEWKRRGNVPYRILTS
jgi:hypothetical protein